MNRQGIDDANFNTETSISQLEVYWSMGDLFPKTYGFLKIGNKKSSVLTSKKQNKDDWVSMPATMIKHMHGILLMYHSFLHIWGRE